jgi:hypothetical protein
METTTKPPAPALPPELASLMADAHALGGQAGQGDAPPDGMPPAAPPPMSLVDLNKDILLMAICGGRDTAKELGKIEALRKFTDPEAEKIAQLWAEVLAKRNINLSAYMGEYLDVCLACWTTYKILAPIGKEIAAEYKQKKAQAPAEPAQSAPKKEA